MAGQKLTPIGRLIPVDKIDPNPEQPRVEIGDLTDLTSSIQEKGVLEPLLVKPSGVSGRWMIIAGERRWRAARAAGLREVPCMEMDVDDRAVAEIALIENMQRKDLTAWEEADGLWALCERFGYTHEDVAKKVGKSRSSVTEALSITTLPEEIREECRRADIGVKSLLLQIVRQPDVEAMRQLIREISEKNLTRDEARAARRSKIEGKPQSASARARVKPFTCRFELPESEVQIELSFRKGEVEKREIISTLQAILNKLEKELEVAATDEPQTV
ncbi:MAG TPA: ParB/RepB/Spo0J family partition protein [Pyrinomonadaceae bacterium]|nr:ParB/RepB/Spo0J family partition protein [Pyrinomonadaceae bacterium]